MTLDQDADVIPRTAWGHADRSAHPLLVSDGTDTPAELVRQGSERRTGRGRLDRSRHLRRADEAALAGERVGVEVVRGMELSCRRQGNSVHLLAYGAIRRHPGSPRRWRRYVAVGWAGWRGSCEAWLSSGFR